MSPLRGRRLPRHGSRRAQGADLRERRGPPTQCLLGLPLRDGRSCETRRHVDDVRILRGAAVRVPQLLVSTTQVFSVEHGNGSIAEQLRTAGPSLGRRVIQAGHKVIIQLHEHLTSAHGPYGPTGVSKGAWDVLVFEKCIFARGREVPAPERAVLSPVGGAKNCRTEARWARPRRPPALQSAPCAFEAPPHNCPGDALHRSRVSKLYASQARSPVQARTPSSTYAADTSAHT